MASATPAAPSASPGPREDGAGARFSPELMYAAARMYYVEEATQAQVSARLGTSRATVSRLLSEARRQGIVRIEVVPPAPADDGDLADRLASVLGLRAVHLGAAAPTGRSPDLGITLGPVVARVLAGVGLGPGDVLLVSSGRSTYEVAGTDLPHLPGVRVAPTVGGTDQADAWYQTNEATRRVAERLGGTPLFLFAPALPGPGLYEELLADPGTRRVLDAWDEAKVALVGIGAPPRTRTSLASFVDRSDPVIMDATGDVCNRFFDEEGRPVAFRGAERLVATTLDHLRALERCVAVAVGTEKVPSITAAARARCITDLITDPVTARALLAANRPEAT
ncbi:sugar-binding transcriptional regulator [uncultured Pseudokineococcus sp.]|uniref:sugar-binding transcriptional regulator n=1 Tax=uncultured Pseudokineococcus sp. TaxID=1642928 RepID=UPI00260C113B|nr:sugar-binding domain-containing protein [uncultured Pseudokineococcus sp.]